MLGGWEAQRSAECGIGRKMGTKNNIKQRKTSILSLSLSLSLSRALSLSLSRPLYMFCTSHTYNITVYVYTSVKINFSIWLHPTRPRPTTERRRLPAVGSSSIRLCWLAAFGCVFLRVPRTPVCLDGWLL